MTADARIEPGVADVGNELSDEHQRDRYDRAGEQEIDVVVAGHVHERLPEALIAEHHFDNDDAGQSHGKSSMITVNGTISALRRACLSTNCAEGEALKASGADILRAHHLDHRGASCHARDLTHPVQRDSNDGQSEIVEAQMSFRRRRG